MRFFNKRTCAVCSLIVAMLIFLVWQTFADELKGNMNPKVANDVVNAETSKAQNLNITNKVKLVQDSPDNKPFVLQASGNSINEERRLKII